MAHLLQSSTAQWVPNSSIAHMAQSNISEYENKHLYSSMAHLVQSSSVENTKLWYYKTDEYEDKNFYSSTAHMVQSNIYEYENKHLYSSIAQLVTDENENKNFYHSNCYSSTAHLKGSTKLERHWIGPNSVNRDNIGLTPGFN